MNLTHYPVIESSWPAGNSRIQKLSLTHSDQHPRITDGSTLLQGIKAQVKSFLTKELQLKTKPALIISSTEEKHLELKPDHGGRNERKVGKTEEKEDNRKCQREERVFSIKISERC